MTGTKSVFILLFTYNLDDKIPFSPPVIKINEDDLLPSSQAQSSLDQGNGEGWFHQRCPHMRKAVAIAPASIVVIRDIGWDNLFYCLL